MTFKDYSDISETFAMYKSVIEILLSTNTISCDGLTNVPSTFTHENIYYSVLGLCGESGEIANKVKKILRDNDGILLEEVRQDLKSELGDVLWYLSDICKSLGLTLDEVAEYNIEKLTSRKERNKLTGSGDNR